MPEEKSFLEEYSKLNNNTEIPGIFAVWCGLAGLSCAMARRCWIDMGIYTIFPNMYIVLVASSGRCRKSVSISVMENLLRQLEPSPNLISQKITPEALIDAIKVVQTNDDKVFLKESCVGFVIADEINTFLNKKTYEAGLGSILTSMFDCKSHFSYHTKGRGIEVLNDSCLGLLAGTTVEWLKAAMPDEAIGGGLTSRIVFVYCATEAKPVAITRRSKEQGEIEESLLKKLKKIMTLEGEVKLTQDAWDYYEQNYNKFYKETTFYDMPTLAGYASRRHVHLLKLAMLFAVSNRMEINVIKTDIESADRILTLSEKAMPMLLNIITSNETGLVTQEVYEYIKKASCISRKTLLAKISHKTDARNFSYICDTLIQSGRIVSIFKDKDIYYSPI